MDVIAHMDDSIPLFKNSFSVWFEMIIDVNYNQP